MKRRAPRSPFIQSNRIVVGVDIAKDDCVAVAQDGSGGLTKPLKFSMSRLGFAALVAYARKATASTGSEGFVIALEPTGHYGIPLVGHLLDNDVEVLKVEPLHTNRAKELFDGTRRKTDAKDAGLIAGLARQGVYRTYRLQRGVFAELRYFGRRRQQVVEELSRTTNRLHRHLDEIFPELPRLFRRKLRPTVLAILAIAPTPTDVRALTLDELEAIIRAGSRGQLGAERARAVHEAAEATIGSTEAPAAHALAIGQLVDHMQHLRGQRRGRSYARQMLFLAVLRVRAGNFAVARARLLERGKEPKVAAVANMSRLLRVIHALVRDDAVFDAAHGQPAEVPLAA